MLPGPHFLPTTQPFIGFNPTTPVHTQQYGLPQSPHSPFIPLLPVSSPLSPELAQQQALVAQDQQQKQLKEHGTEKQRASLESKNKTQALENRKTKVQSWFLDLKIVNTRKEHPAVHGNVSWSHRRVAQTVPSYGSNPRLRMHRDGRILFVRSVQGNSTR